MTNDQTTVGPLGAYSPNDAEKSITVKFHKPRNSSYRTTLASMLARRFPSFIIHVSQGDGLTPHCNRTTTICGVVEHWLAESVQCTVDDVIDSLDRLTMH